MAKPRNRRARLSTVATVVVFVLALVAGALYWLAAVPPSVQPDGADSRLRYQPGPYAVLREQIALVDSTRGTQAYRGYAGSPERALNGSLWRPAGLAAPGPLVIYSHGFMSYHREGLYLARFLASHGYTVAAVDYPLTGMRAPDSRPLLADVVNQPGDVRFLIDSLLARNAAKDDVLHGTLDPTRIAAAGLSLGGLTSLLATYHHGLRDPRIAAAVSIAGPTSLFRPALFDGADRPLLMVYGTGDAVVPYADNALPVPAMYPRATLVTLREASHAGFAYPAATFMRFMRNPDRIGCWAVVNHLNLADARQDTAFVARLSDGEPGVDPDQQFTFCAGELPAQPMRAIRQQMFTALATHAFLDSRFATDIAVRQSAAEYLAQTLGTENGADVQVAPAEIRF